MTFQSTPSQRGRLSDASKLTDVQKISIHALAKRATNNIANCQRAAYNFNPRPRKEGDIAFKVYHTSIRYFNPRPRKEGDKKH